MLCCVIAACLVVKILVRWRALAKYFGISVRGGDNPYGYVEYDEFDVYKN
jgi:hypothetical protein